MCLAGNEAEIIAALDALKKAREMREVADKWMNDDEVMAIDLNAEEARAVLDSRIVILEERCRKLGCHGPAPKANAADQVRIASQK